MSWKGAGVVDDLGNGESIFSGTMTGILLVKHLPEGAAPAQVHATQLDCQAIFRISENEEERHTALCIMRAHDGKDLAYGECDVRERKTNAKASLRSSVEGADSGVLRGPPRTSAVSSLRTRKRARSTEVHIGRS